MAATSIVIHQTISNFADFDFVNFYVADVIFIVVLGQSLTDLLFPEAANVSLFDLQLTLKTDGPW